jgi:hypothetical protein
MVSLIIFKILFKHFHPYKGILFLKLPCKSVSSERKAVHLETSFHCSGLDVLGFIFDSTIVTCRIISFANWHRFSSERDTTLFEEIHFVHAFSNLLPWTTIIQPFRYYNKIFTFYSYMFLFCYCLSSRRPKCEMVKCWIRRVCLWHTFQI